MQAQGRLQAVRPVLSNGLSAITGATPTDADVFYIDIHPDPAAAVEIVLWDDILMTFRDALHVRHNLRTLALLRDTTTFITYVIHGLGKFCELVITRQERLDSIQLFLKALT